MTIWWGLQGQRGEGQWAGGGRRKELLTSQRGSRSRRKTGRVEGLQWGLWPLGALMAATKIAAACVQGLLQSTSTLPAGIMILILQLRKRWSAGWVTCFRWQETQVQCGHPETMLLSRELAQSWVGTPEDKDKDRRKMGW